MRAVLSAHEGWETTIAPRLILGLWHPKFVHLAVEILPNVKRCFIGVDLTLAQYPVFWNACDAFSIAFPSLATAEGERFRQRCKYEGKDIFTWTCNRQEEWAMAAAWNLDVVMTDTPTHYLAERKAVTGTSRHLARCSHAARSFSSPYANISFSKLQSRNSPSFLATLGSCGNPYITILFCNGLPDAIFGEDWNDSAALSPRMLNFRTTCFNLHA